MYITTQVTRKKEAFPLFCEGHISLMLHEPYLRVKALHVTINLSINISMPL